MMGNHTIGTVIQTRLSSGSIMVLQPVCDSLDKDALFRCSIDQGLKQWDTERLGELIVAPLSHRIRNSLFLVRGYILSST